MQQFLHKISEPVTITLKPGMGWALYTDKGPLGICGQSMDITQPHAMFVTWESEDAMRAGLKKVGRKGSRANLEYGVVGEWSTAGMSINV